MMNLKGISSGRITSVNPLAATSVRAFTPRRLALVTDAWKPQTNGVVNSLVKLIKNLEAK